MVHESLVNEPPLIQAIFRNDLARVRQLLLDSVDVNYQDREGRSALHAAAFVGNADIADSLLLSGARVNKRDNLWTTPLHRACRNDHPDVVEVLLRHGAEVGARDRNWQTPLHVCAAGDAVRCAEYLLPVAKETLDAGDRQGATPLHHASFRGHMRLVELLVAYGADVDAKDKKERRSIHWAAFRGHVDVVGLLVEAGADAHARDRELLSPLHCASAYGQLAVCRFLVGRENKEAGALAVEAASSHGNTPLHYAANFGKGDVVLFLLDAGASLEPRNGRRMTPLHLAAVSSDGTASMELLLDRGAEADATGADGRTPLHLTAIAGRFARAHTLISRGAQVDRTDSSGNSTLHIACRSGHELLIKKLLDCGANVSGRNSSGATPLHLAAFQGFLDPLRTLVARGAHVRVLDADGRSVLHFACLSHNNSLDAVRYLLERGANPRIADKAGKLALHVASERGDVELIRLLATKCPESAWIRDEAGRTALHLAAANDPEAKCVQFLLGLGADSGAVDHSGFLPIHYAAVRGCALACSKLMDRRPWWTVGGRCQLTPLHLAARQGHLEVLRLLLQGTKHWRSRSALPVDKRGWSPLHWAAAFGHCDCVKMLVEAAAPDASLLRPEAIRRLTPLHLAAGFGHVDCLRVMLAESSIDGKEAFICQSSGSRTPLMFAATSGSLETLEYVLIQRPPLDSVDAEGRTALHRAAGGGWLKQCERLVASRADVWSRDGASRTPFHLAVQADRFPVVQFLFSKMSDGSGAFRLPLDRFLRHPVHWAAYLGNEQMLEWLLETCDLRCLRESGLSPIHCAAASGKTTALQILLEALDEMSIDVRDRLGRTGLHLATLAGSEAVARHLVDAGADPNAVDCRGRTPLSYAAASGFLPLIELLLRSGAELRPLDAVRNSALHYACQKGQEEAALLLLSQTTLPMETLNAQNRAGKSALHLAASKGQVGVVERLLMCGAGVWTADEEGRTPALNCAASPDVSDCLELLLMVMVPDSRPVSARLSQRVSLTNLTDVLKNPRLSSANLSGQSSDSEFY